MRQSPLNNERLTSGAKHKSRRLRAAIVCASIASWALGAVLVAGSIPACGASIAFWTEVVHQHVSRNLLVVLLLATIGSIGSTIIAVRRFPRGRNGAALLTLLTIGVFAMAWVWMWMGVSYATFDFTRETCVPSPSPAFGVYWWVGIGAAIAWLAWAGFGINVGWHRPEVGDQGPAARRPRAVSSASHEEPR